MRKPDIEYKKLVLVCVNERENGMESCGQKNSLEFYKKLKAEIKKADPKIRVSRTGCLGNCLSGVSVVIQPANKWLGEVKMEDIPEIVLMVLEGR